MDGVFVKSLYPLLRNYSSDINEKMSDAKKEGEINLKTEDDSSTKTIATIVRNRWTIAVSFGASLIKFVEHLSTEF